MQNYSPGRRPWTRASRVTRVILTWHFPGRGRSLGRPALLARRLRSKSWVGLKIPRIFFSLPTLADTPEHCENAIHELTTLRARLANDSARQSEALTRIDAIIESLTRSAAASGSLVRRLSTLVQLTKTMFDAMDFGFLFDPTRKLFSIGYRVSDNSLDPSSYDLLASEARLTSFIAIAKGDVP